MAKKSFNECYFTTTNEIEYLDEINDYIEGNDGNIGRYENSMFCPECRNAELCYVHKTSQRRAFLRRKSGTVHLGNCSYNYEYSSSKFSKEYYESLSDEQIQDKMDSMMRLLLQEGRVNRDRDEGNETNIVEADNPFILEKENQGQRIRRSLRRKKLNQQLDEKISGELHLF